MRFLLATTLKDLRRRRRDPFAVLLWMLIPFAVALLMKLAFGGDGGTPRALILIADEDRSVASRLLVSALGQGELGELLEVEPVSLADGERRIHSGDGSVLLVIPDGFGAAVLAEQPKTLRLLENPAQRILPAIAREIIQTLVDGIFYLQRLFGDAARAVPTSLPPGADAMPDSTIVATSIAINAVMNRVAPYVFPPLIRLETIAAGATATDGAAVSADAAASGDAAGDSADEGGIDFGRLFLPSLLFMGLLFVALGMSEDVWREHHQGTLRRVMTTPRGLAVTLAGKLLAGGIVLLAMSAVGIVTGRFLFGLALASPLLAIVWAALSGTFLLLILMTVQVHASSERAGHLVTHLAIFPLAMLGGSFFPFAFMPDWMAAIGRWTPNGWAVGQFQSIIDGTVEPGGMAAALVALVAIGAACFVLCLARLGRRFVHA